jgi:CDGSH-type Zn-finger protein
VRGAIPIESASGKQYERRNRVTLCRCGASENKPFCDGSHLSVKFNDQLLENVAD